MSDGLAVFGHIRTLKKHAKEYSLEQLYEMQQKFATVIASIEEDLKTQEAEEKARREKIASFKAMMDEEGLTMDDLAAFESEQRVSKRPVKYCLVDEDGKEHFWTGIGRMPVVYRKALEGDKTLKDFEI